VSDTAAPLATGPAYGTGLVTGGLRSSSVEDRPGNVPRDASSALVLLTSSLERAFQILPFVLLVAGVIWGGTAARRPTPVTVGPAT